MEVLSTPFLPLRDDGSNAAARGGTPSDRQGPFRGDFVEKVEKSSVTKTRQTAIRWNIAAQHHLRPVEDGARCPIDKLAGPPADFLNAALVGLPEIEHRRKGVFQHNRSKMRAGAGLAGGLVPDRNADP